jgi:hypothetical protein
MTKTSVTSITIYCHYNFSKLKRLSYNILPLQSFKPETTSVTIGGVESMYILNASQKIPLGQHAHLSSSFIHSLVDQIYGLTSHKHQYFGDLQSCITLLTLEILTNTTSCRHFLGCKVQLQILNSKLLKLWTTQWPCWEYLTFATFQLLVCETGQQRSRATTLAEWQTMSAVITLTNWTLPLQKQKNHVKHL